MMIGAEIIHFSLWYWSMSYIKTSYSSFISNTFQVYRIQSSNILAMSWDSEGTVQEIYEEIKPSGSTCRLKCRNRQSAGSQTCALGEPECALDDYKNGCFLYWLLDQEPEERGSAGWRGTCQLQPGRNRAGPQELPVHQYMDWSKQVNYSCTGCWGSVLKGLQHVTEQMRPYLFGETHMPGEICQKTVNFPSCEDPGSQDREIVRSGGNFRARIIVVKAWGVKCGEELCETFSFICQGSFGYL